jgi:1,2-phenylacetyl-CoA epoxidase PaaB subunit
MSKRPSKRIAAEPLYEWRIIRLKKTPAALIGYVDAPDQEQAIAKAVESFRVREQDRWRLGAYKVRKVQL